MATERWYNSTNGMTGKDKEREVIAFQQLSNAIKYWILLVL